MPNSPDPQAPDLGFCDRRTCILGLIQQSPSLDLIVHTMQEH